MNIQHRKLSIFIIGLFVATLALIVFYPTIQKVQARVIPVQVEDMPSFAVLRPKIQLAILLDTSGSMSGLIDQTRNQLWQVVNEFAETRKNGIRPLLEVAVYEYGNSRLSGASGYTRQVSALTSELDQVSEALFSLNTNGGDEYCGYAIDTAVANLDWSKSDADIRAIFIAGNEPFTQGPVPFKEAIKRAHHKGITVNTIHAGGYEEGIRGGWRKGAMLAGGDYMSIDHNHQVAHIIAPQDDKIAELNARLNNTYIPYGADGQEKAARQVRQDEKSDGISVGLLAKRAKSKISELYRNSSWDLVDATEEGAVDLLELDADQLPEELQSLDAGGRVAYIEKKAREREEIKQEIKVQTEARDQFVAAAKEAVPAATVPTVGEALSSAVRRQGEARNYVFDKKN